MPWVITSIGMENQCFIASFFHRTPKMKRAKTPVIAPGISPCPVPSIFTQLIVTPASTRQKSARPYVTKMVVRCIIITATARSTEPSGPSSARR